MDLEAYKSSTQKRGRQLSDKVHPVNLELWKPSRKRHRLTINDDLQEKGKAGTQATGKETACWRRSRLQVGSHYHLLVNFAINSVNPTLLNKITSCNTWWHRHRGIKLPETSEETSKPWRKHRKHRKHRQWMRQHGSKDSTTSSGQRRNIQPQKTITGDLSWKNTMSTQTWLCCGMRTLSKLPSI